MRFQRLSLRVIACFALLSTGAFVMSANVCAEEDAAEHVSLTTAYMARTIAGAHTISLRGALGERGTLLLDPNACQVNPFGDRTICTRMAAQPVAVNIRPQAVEDPSGRNRVLYSLSRVDSDKAAWPQFELSYDASANGVIRLIVKENKQTSYVLTMERVASKKPKPPVKPTPPTKPTPPVKPTPPSKPTPAMIAVAKSVTYRAEQRGTAVKLIATGNHPAAGWQSQFEDSPAATFPPQYRFVSIPPKGMVAQVISPFEVSRSFRSDKPIASIAVHDAAGPHTVAVVQRK